MPFGTVLFLAMITGAGSVLGAPAMVEVAEERNLNQRVWRSTELVEENDRLTGQVWTREKLSQIVEVGDFLCYQNAAGDWTPSAPRWTVDGGLFRSQGTGYEGPLRALQWKKTPSWLSRKAATLSLN